MRVDCVSVAFSLEFRGKNECSHMTVKKLGEQYGKVFTFWLGRRPSVVIVDIDYAIDAFRDKRTDFAGRPKSNFISNA